MNYTNLFKEKFIPYSSYNASYTSYKPSCMSYKMAIWGQFRKK